MNSDTPNRENFVRHTIVDRQQQGVVLGTFDYPDGWEAESRVFWNYQNSNLPAVFEARIFNPEKFEMFEFLPMESFSWSEPETGFYGRGQNVGGVVNLPPMSGIDALVHLIIPKYRGDRPGLRIIETNAEPAPVKAPAQIPPQNVFGHRISVKIEYSENGRVIEEEFGCLHTVCQLPPFSNGWGMTYFTGWSLTELCCFRAARGQFNDARPAFLKILSSFQVNPEWSQLVNKISQMLNQNAHQMAQDSIQAGWDILRINAEGSRQFMAHNQAYVDRQQQRIEQSYNTPPATQSDSTRSNSSDSEYTVHNAFIDAVREEESIYNPENTANEKVSGHHDHIWTDQFGNVQATNDPNYDPNVGSNRNWTEARKKRIGD